MTDECNHESPANPECPRWYRTSFVFILLSFQLFSVGMLLFGIVTMLIAAANIRNDDWYKHRWPWFIVTLFSATLVMTTATRLISNANPDPVVPIYQPNTTQ